MLLPVVLKNPGPGIFDCRATDMDKLAIITVHVMMAQAWQTLSCRQAEVENSGPGINRHGWAEDQGNG